MILGVIEKGAKINLKVSYLIWRQVFCKKQRALSNREKFQKCLKFDSGCTVWQSSPQNLLNINLPNFVG